jgi:hypothetical protein
LLVSLQHEGGKLMDYITQLLNYFLVLHSNITAFRFVIYCPDWRIKVREYHWVKAADLSAKLEWLGQRGIELAEEHQLYPWGLTLGLANTVLVFDKKSKKKVMRYIPMIDFASLQSRPDEAPESITVALELLDMCPGVIARTTIMNFGFVGYHFVGFGLWSRERWMKFVTDGLYDEYGFSKDRSLPMYPKMPYYAAKLIGESWCRLVRKQHGLAFLRIAEKNALGSAPEVMELFFGGMKLLVDPPDHAPCMVPFREAKEKWYETVDEWVRILDEHSARKFTYKTAPQILDFCVAECPINGCSMECPATMVRLERKVRRIKGSSEVKQHKLSGPEQPKLLSE